MNEVPNASYIESLLKGFGFQRIHRQHNGFTALCKFHTERHPSFSISDTGLWMCWSCGIRGNLRQLIDRLGDGKMDWKDDLRAAGVLLSRFDSKPKKHHRVAVLPDSFRPYPDAESVPPVIRKRLKFETIQRFGLGATDPSESSDWRLKNRCIIPIYHAKKCVGFHARALLPDMLPRYYNPVDFDIKDYLFNYDACTKGAELIVLEGAFNCMSMTEKGFPNTVATFGTKLKSEQIRKILRLNPSSITLCFDRDPSKIKNGKEVGYAGQRATKAIGKSLADLLDVYVMPLPFGSDPNDLDAKTLRLCHDKRLSFRLLGGTR